jgi:hypothetical protein
MLFVLDYLFIKLDFISDAVKLLKFCNAIVWLWKWELWLLVCNATYSDKFVNVLEEPAALVVYCCQAIQWLISEEGTIYGRYCEHLKFVCENVPCLPLLFFV